MFKISHISTNDYFKILALLTQLAMIVISNLKIFFFIRFRLFRARTRHRDNQEMKIRRMRVNSFAVRVLAALARSRSPILGCPRYSGTIRL